MKPELERNLIQKETYTCKKSEPIGNMNLKGQV
jgi:hypothetical protein